MATILAVDDSTSIRNLIQRTLEDKGYDVVVAEDGVHAMEIARSRTFDMVLTDINMPNMSGISLVSKLRRLETYKDTPIVMVTTEDKDFKKEKAKNLGANGWLQKPFTQERLLNVVEVILHKYSKAS